MYAETKIETMVFDFKNKDTHAEYQALCDDIHKIADESQLSILVNNLEHVDPWGSDFANASDQEIVRTINANTFPMIMMTRFLGPPMVKREDFKSAVINMVGQAQPNEM